MRLLKNLGDAWVGRICLRRVRERRIEVVERVVGREESRTGRKIQKRRGRPEAMEVRIVVVASRIQGKVAGDQWFAMADEKVVGNIGSTSIVEDEYRLGSRDSRSACIADTLLR